MLKILQARLQLYVNCELPHVQSGFRKGREARDQIANINCIIKKVREFQKNIYFGFIDYTKALDYVLLLSHFSRVRLCATPQTSAHLALLPLGFSRQEHWSGLPFPSPMHESEK